MWMWIGIAIIAVTAIITEMITKNKKIELKRLEREIELEKIRLETFDKETEKMRIELEQSKQAYLKRKWNIRSCYNAGFIIAIVSISSVGQFRYQLYFSVIKDLQ